MGICPPSKPAKFMLPVRAFWPLPPRPAVLPWPLACPRPTRFFSFTPPPRGGVNRVNSFIVFLRRSPCSLGASRLHLVTSNGEHRDTEDTEFFCFSHTDFL